MDDPNRPTAKRQIARLLGSSSIPICVVSEDDVVVFANDAMGTMVGRACESLLGLHCGRAVPADKTADSELSAFFSLPTHWSRNVLKLIPESGVVPISQAPSVDANCQASTWIRCLIPLEENGCVLCAFCPSQHAMTEVLDAQTAETQSLLRTSRAKHLRLDNMWYLQGASAGSRRALEQVQLAIENTVSLTVFGPAGSGRSWLANTLFERRKERNTNKPTAKHESLLRIDCSLMDSDLLLSMLEVVDESKKPDRETPTILFDHLECLAPECLSIVLSFLEKHSHVKYIATCDAELVARQNNLSSSWNVLLTRLACMRIDLPQLKDRIEDMPALLAAWFDSHPKSEFGAMEMSHAFLDAVNAYSWPGDIEEFSESLVHATKNATSNQLTENELPVSIRTFVSHVEQTFVDEAVDLDAILEDVEKTMILRALEKYPQNKTSAAKILNISRARLLRRLQQWGIQAESGSADGEEDLPDFSEVT